MAHAKSRTRQRNPMTAINQTNALKNRLVRGLMARDSVQVMAEEIFFCFVAVYDCLRTRRKTVIGRQGSPHMPRGSSGMVQPEIVHILFMDTVTRRA